MPDLGPVLVPPEVFHRILAHLPREQLPDLSLVSKAWNFIVTPILYKRIHLNWKRTRHVCVRSHLNEHPSSCPCESNRHCTPGYHKQEYPRLPRLRPCLEIVHSLVEDYPSLYLLVRTVVSKPMLASCVQQLCLAGPVPRSVWTEPQQTQLTNDDRSQIRHLLRTGPPIRYSEKTWVRELDNGSPSAFAALLLMCLSNLRTVEISADFKDTLSFIGCLATFEQRFPSLHTASIGTSRNQVFMGPGRAPLVRTTCFDSLFPFYVSSIRRLSLNIPKSRGDCDFEWPIKEMVPLVVNLESLELPFTFLDEHDLAHVLEACPNLRVLKYDLWTTCCSDWQPKSGVLVDLSALERALSPVKATLETFHLHIGKHMWSSGSWYEHHDHMLGHMSFKDFPRLTTLHAPLRAMVSDKKSATELLSAVPRSLQTLWINGDGFNFPYEHEPGSPSPYLDIQVIKVMSDFLVRWQDFAPSLKSIKILAYQVPYFCGEQWDPEGIANAVEPLGREQGLKVSVIMLPYRQSFPSQVIGCLMGQGPPYFDLDIIEKYRVSKKSDKRGPTIDYTTA